MTVVLPQPSVERLPRHIAIIMDGNGRWAKRRHLPRIAGHRKGADAVRRAVEGCLDLGIQYLTLYAFSSENWKRPAEEVDDLMGLLRLYLRQELNDLHRNNVQVRFIGERDRLSKDIVSLINEAETMTAQNTRMGLVIALNYGAHAEITAAAKALARDVAAGNLALDDVTERTFGRYLATDGLPDPDLIIRTSGEQRLSNFLLWQAAYAELVFLDCFWPDFSRSTLDDAVQEFQRRERRYGANNGQ
ncbi:MAG: isoprenyl transferase [Pseudomonadota bacterium]